VLTSVLFNVLVVWVVMLSPVVLGLSVAIQVYEDATLLVSGMFTVPPLQIVAVPTLVMAGVGLTVTETVCAAPVQLPVEEVGVTV
jgi:hypothetical protein